VREGQGHALPAPQLTATRADGAIELCLGIRVTGAGAGWRLTLACSVPVTRLVV